MLCVTELKIHSIAVCCNNRGIGYKGKLPWNLPKEYSYFLNITTGNPPKGKQNAVIMGEKAWESNYDSLKTLRNRYNFVLSSSMVGSTEGPDAVVSSLEELITLLSSDKWKDKIHEVFNLGGSDIYKLVHDSQYCGNIYLTRVLADFECDTFFPSLSDEFQQLSLADFPNVPQTIQEEEGLKWEVEVYRKK